MKTMRPIRLADTLGPEKAEFKWNHPDRQAAWRPSLTLSEKHCLLANSARVLETACTIIQAREL
jgi:hypothetical protein